jgi:hypothetical protein
MESKVEHKSAAGFAKNADELVTLYASDGESVQVAESKVETWLARGFSRVKLDPEELVNEVDVLGDNIGAPWRDYVAACKKKGYIDAKAQEVAHESLREFCAACDRLHRAIHETYRTQEEN